MLLENTSYGEKDLQTVKIKCGCGHIQKLEIDTFDINGEELDQYKHGLCKKCQDGIDDLVIKQQIADYEKEMEAYHDNLCN